MGNKYYTPDIENIRVGYKCEREETIEGYKPYIFDLQGVRDYIQFEISDYKDFFIRTPYLTKEQIEAEGWEWMTTYFYKNHKRLNYDYTSNRLWVWDMFDNKYFDGYCPSVNEFRTINKLLNIK